MTKLLLVAVLLVGCGGPGSIEAADGGSSPDLPEVGAVLQPDSAGPGGGRFSRCQASDCDDRSLGKASDPARAARQER